jgi:hypothetical protein
MHSDPVSLRRLKRRNIIYGAVIGFLIVLLTAGAANGIALIDLHQKLADEGEDEAEFLAASVSRTLGQQLERAASLDIPLQALPDLELTLHRRMSRVAGISAVTVLAPNGETVASAGNGNKEQVMVTKEIRVNGKVWGRLAVSTTPIMLSTAFQSARNLSLAMLSAFALLGALAGGWVAFRVSQDQGRLFHYLNKPATRNDVMDGPRTQQQDVSLYLSTTDPMRNAWQAAYAQEARTANENAAVHRYASELLALDFNHAMRPRIAELTDVDGVRLALSTDSFPSPTTP